MEESKRVRFLLDEISKEMGLGTCDEATLDCLKYRAFFDERTGLLRYDEKLLIATIENYLKDVNSLYYLRFDLNDFSSYNKEHGHRKGDEILKSFAEFLLKAFGDEARVYRYGGDEFDVICSIKNSVDSLLNEVKISWAKESEINFSCGYEAIKKNSTLSDIQNACDKNLFDNKP